MQMDCLTLCEYPSFEAASLCNNENLQTTSHNILVDNYVVFKLLIIVY